MIKVCSGFSPSGRIQYGERFLRSFDKYMPKDIALEVFVEEPMPMPRRACRDLWEIPGAKDFHEKHRDSPTVAGRGPVPGWKEKERQRGYSFRFDAYKFWKQILIPQQSSIDMRNGDILIWMDADVEVTARPSSIDLLDLIGDADLCYLNREPKHSEIGFWAVRISDQSRKFLSDMASIYTTGQVFELQEWHSAFVWDTARKRSGLREISICKRGSRGHVWPATKLARWFRHDKGKRKPNI